MDIGDESAQAAEARRLRVELQLSGREIQERLGVTKTRLQRWLRGIPPPEWTRRPTAKDDLRSRAMALRVQGWSVNDIAVELGVARSTAWQWVRHMPLDPDSERARMKREKGRQLVEGRWREHRIARDTRRAELRSSAFAEVGALTDREVLLLGAAIYWCEGAKNKPWRPSNVTLSFTNSDPVLIDLFLRFLALRGHPREELSYRVSIHESADAEAAQVWWIEQLGLPAGRFHRPTLKRHKPTTRRNTGASYHGCLVVTVPKGTKTYLWIEGVVSGLADASRDDE